MNSYQAGSVMHLSATLGSIVGSAIDPDDVYMQVKKPRGEVINLQYGVDVETVRTDTRQYRYDIGADEAGT